MGVSNGGWTKAKLKCTSRSIFMTILVIEAQRMLKRRKTRYEFKDLAITPETPETGRLARSIAVSEDTRREPPPVTLRQTPSFSIRFHCDINPRARSSIKSPVFDLNTKRAKRVNRQTSQALRKRLYLQGVAANATYQSQIFAQHEAAMKNFSLGAGDAHGDDQTEKFTTETCAASKVDSHGF
ncbi:hypothetical protein BGZ63DRAFT_457161 [Mariannaea sp. PMI_226]|nr:hypothetical protein BGZ63DRAFT_457161 [Mariannaea sp. PMI_226]